MLLFRRVVVAGVAAGLLALAYADVNACGDKFMRPGRSVSSRRYAALHPSSILIYRPARSTSPGMAMFEDMLKAIALHRLVPAIEIAQHRRALVDVRLDAGQERRVEHAVVTEHAIGRS